MTAHVSEQTLDKFDLQYDDAFALAGNIQRILTAHRLSGEMVAIENEDGESVSGFHLIEETLTDGGKVYKIVFQTL